METLLEMKGITKVYDNGVLANDRVDISLAEREIHAIAGENGAGKSTVMKILYGLESCDEGDIYIRGERVDIRSPRDAMALGIGMVHQHFMLVNELTVYENIFLGFEPTRRGGFLDKKQMVERTQELGRKYGMEIDPHALCGSLPVGVAQKVEILKVLARGASVLILDEPTAVLTPQETRELFAQLRLLREAGCTCVMITHKLKEIIELCDRVTILRAGKSMGIHEVAQLTEQDISRLMVGRDVTLTLEKPAAQPAGTVLEVKHLDVTRAGGKKAVDNAAFTVHAGEIVCLAGVEGNGQREVVRCITGLHTAYGGQVLLHGQDVKKHSIRTIRGAGLAHIPEDRMVLGANLGASILDNLISVSYEREARLGFLPYGRLRAKAAGQMADFDIKASGSGVPIGMLSGGNMQKVVVAREVGEAPTLLVADQPTRGVDVGAMEFIHRQLLRLRSEGCAILLISADMSEVFNLSDRILVFHEGEITAEITDIEHLTEDQLGRYMLGVERMERRADDAG